MASFPSVFAPVGEVDDDCSHSKISVVGTGSVGMAVAFSIMAKSIANEIALVDYDENKVKGEVLDMQQCSQFTDTCKIVGGNKYYHTAKSRIVFLTAGVRQQVNESRLKLTQRNLDIFKVIVPEIVKYSPDCIIVVVANPVDILTYVTWKLSGFPKNRVFGSGTLLDSARFRHILGKKLDLSATAVHGYVIGEHGDSSVPVWSKVSCGGLTLSSIYPKIGGVEDPENFNEVHKEVVNSAYEIIKLKGYTSWAIGLCCATLCHSLLNNRRNILPVSTSVKGMYGITSDVFLSVPCVVGGNGIASIVNLPLTSEEEQKLQKSATTLNENIKGLIW